MDGRQSAGDQVKGNYREIIMEELIEILKEKIRGEIRVGEPMYKHTSFKIGGPADIFVLPEGIDDIQQVVQFAYLERLPLFVLGRGSNLLVKDQGIKGIVLKTSPGLNHLEFNGEWVRVGAGISLPYLAKAACENGLSGLEFIAGVPGTVGGAIVMNAGAAGHSLDELVSTVKVMDLSGEIKELFPADLEFGYRRSCLQQQDLIVLETELRLRKSNREEIRETMDTLLKNRKKTQPLSFPNAGSIFKNPGDSLGPAGRLIDLAGAKGMRVGDAQVSELHANFIVNLGTAKASHVLKLMEEIQKIVKNKFGVFLEPEVKIVGG